MTGYLITYMVQQTADVNAASPKDAERYARTWLDRRFGKTATLMSIEPKPPAPVQAAKAVNQ